MARGGAGGDAQASVTPFAQFAQPIPGGLHFRQDFLGMHQELLAGLCEHDGFAHFVQKTTAHLAFQSLHRMADGRLRQVELARGACERPGSGEDGKGAQLPAVQGILHI